MASEFLKRKALEYRNGQIKEGSSEPPSTAGSSYVSTTASGFLRRKAEEQAVSISERFGENAYGGTKWRNENSILSDEALTGLLGRVQALEIPGSAAGGLKTSGGFYSRPADPGEDFTDISSQVSRLSGDLRAYSVPLQSAVTDLEKRESNLKIAESYLTRAWDAYSAAPSEGNAEAYNQIAAAYDQAWQAYTGSYESYKTQWDRYKAMEDRVVQIVDAYRKYTGAQQAAYDDWRGTIRDAAAIKQELAGVKDQIRKLEAQEGAAKVGSFLGNIGENVIRSSSGLPGNTDYRFMGTSEELHRLRQLKDLLQEELDWSGYYFYDEYTKAKDFAQKSVYATTANGLEPKLNGLAGIYTETGFDDLTYDYINRNPDARSRASVNSIGDNSAFLGLDKSYLGEMDDYEIGIFNYLYATEGADAAYRYTAQLTGDLNRRQREKQEAKWAEYAREHPLGSSAFTVLTSPLKGLSYLGQVADLAATGDIDPNAAYNKFSYVPGTMREEVAKTIEKSGKWGPVGSFAYQTGLSMADFLFATGISGGNSALAMTIMGSGAAADTTMAAKERGVEGWKAMTLGALAGIAEAVTEKVSIDTLLNPELLMDGTAMYILKNALAEGAEEGASDLINLFCDILIAGGDSQWRQSIDAYMADGKTEKDAFLATFADQVITLGLDVLGGAISGAALSGGNALIQSRDNNFLIKKYNLNNIDQNGARDIINSGLESAKDTESYRLAEQLKEKLDAGTIPTADELARLCWANERAIREEGPAVEEAQEEEEPEGLRLRAVDEEGDTGEVPAKELLAQAKEDLKSGKITDEQFDAVIDEVVHLEELEDGTSVKTFNTQADSIKANTNGGNIYGNIQRRAEGSAAAQPGNGSGIPGGTGLLHGGSQRYDGAGSPEQAGSLAGSAEQRSSAWADRSRATAARQNYARSLRLEKVSSLDLGLQNGTDVRNIQIMPQEHWDAEMTQLADRIYNETGKGVTYVMGRIQIRGTGGTVGYARGVITGERIIVQADHLRIPMEQIADHEAYHAKAEFTDGRLNAEIRRHITETFSEEEFRKVLDKYIVGLRGVIDVNEARTDAEFEAAVRQIEEEIFADAYAGINAFGAGADRFTGTVNEKMDQLYMGKIRDQDNGTGEPTGPPEGKFSYEDQGGLRLPTLEDDMASGYEGRSLTDDPEIYTYDFLTAQHPMKPVELPDVTSVRDAQGRIDPGKIAEDGIRNALSVGTERDGKVYVKNRYTGRDLWVTASAIRHGLNGPANRILTNGRLGSVAGEIVQNAIPINALHNAADGAKGTYAMAGYAFDMQGRTFVAIITVEQRTDAVSEIDVYDVTHAVSGRQKRSKQVDTKSQGVNPSMLASEISIAEFLEDVKNTYRSILSEDVLDKMGESKSADGYYTDRVRYSYAGENANTADLDALAWAKEMRSAGVADETIRQQTGWHVGMDGKWRWEIDDSGMRYYRAGDALFSEMHPEYARHQELMQKFLYGELTPQEEKEFRKLDEVWGKEHQRLTDRVRKGGATLQNVLSHEELFEAYPQLRKTSLRFVDLPDGTRGRYDPSRDEITLSESLRRVPEDTLIHEIQHVIQKAEGFAQGSSPEFWEQVQKGERPVRANDRRVAEAERKIQEIMDSLPPFVAGQFELHRHLEKSDPDKAMELADALSEGPYGDEFSDFFLLTWDLDMAAGEDNYIRGAGDLYRNTAGEIEARDAASRRQLTVEQRRETTPARADDRTVFVEDVDDFGLQLGDRYSADDTQTYAEIQERQQELRQRELDLQERKRAATSNSELLQAMDEYSSLFTEMRGLLPKRRNGTATQAELDRIEEIKTLRDEYMQRIADLQESLGLAAISQEETEIREEKEALRVASDAAWAREGAERENLAIKKAGLSPSEYFRRKAVKAFKTTTNFNEAGYLLPDGKLLNFSGGERNHRYRDHREIGEIYEATNGVAALNRFLADGNIRIMAESPGADLPAGVEPTREQYAALRKFINSNGVQDGRFYVDFSNADGSRAGNYAYEGRIYADRVINDIKHYYATGETVQRMDLNQFRYSVDDEGSQQAQEQKPAAPKKKIRPAAESRPLIAKKDLRNTVLNLFSIPNGQRAEVGAMIDSYADRLIKNGSLTEDDRKAFFDRMYDAGVMVMPAEEYSAFARSHIVDGRIYVSDSVKADFGDDWADIRRRAFAAGVYLVNDRSASGIDQWNATLSAEDMLPGLFDSEETDERTILERILQVAEEGKDEHLSLAEYTRRLSQQEGISEDEFLDNMERQLDWALRTFAEKARLEIHLRDRTGRKIAQEREKGAERMTRQQAKEAQRRADERQARKDSARRAKERRELRELQQRTLKQLQWLSRNRNRAPEELKETWDEVLGDIDLYAISAADEMRWSDKYNATWKDLAQMYKDAMKNDPNFLPSKELERIVTRLDATKIADMDLGALQDLYKAAIGLRTEFYNRNNVINDEMQRLFAEVYTDAKREIESAPGGFTGGVADKFLNLDQLTPMNVLQRMAGWDPDGAFYSMAKQLERGERDMRAYSVKAQKMLQDFLTEHEDWVKKADGQGKDAIWYEVEVPQLLELGMGDKPIFGPTVKVYMTPAQKVHMYLESKNLDNLRHMTGGRTFVNKDLYSQGKRQEALSQGRTIKLAPETVRKLVSYLTPEEMELAQILDRYYNTFATQEINKVSNILYGYDKAMGKNYAPIYTNRNYTKTEFGVFDTTAEGVGNLKGRQYAVNPSYNISAFDAFERHVDQTARFCGMAIPARNWTTLMNWREKNNSTGDVITHKWGEESKRYITDLITTLQAGDDAKSNTISSGLSKLQSNYITAIFGANPSIVLKQLGSIPLAGAYLDARNVPTPAQISKIDRSLISKYTQELEWRTMGYATPETKQLKDNPTTAMDILDKVAGKATDKLKVSQKTKQRVNKTLEAAFNGGAITAMDGWAASTLWPWAENKVRREHPELAVGTKAQIDSGESAFYKKVAEEFENAISRSQSVSDEMHQGTLRKSRNIVTKTFTMFRSDSAQTYNALRQKIGEAQFYARTGAKDKVQAASKKAVGAVVCALLMNTVWSEAVSFLMALWKNKGKYYRDDEDELTAESVIGEMGRNMMESIMGTVTFGDEIAQLIGNAITGDRRYDLEAPGLEQINEIFNLVQDLLQGNFGRISEAADVVKNGGNLGEYLSDNSGEILGEIKDTATKVATYFGLSVNNVEGYLLGALKWISPELGAAYDDLFQNIGKSDLAGMEGDALEGRVGRILSDRNVSESDDTAAALATLYEAGYKTAIPSDTPTSVSIDGEKHSLGDYQQQAYDTIWGGIVADALDDMVASDSFKEADPKTQAKMLSNLYAYAAEQAKTELFDEYELDSGAAEIAKVVAGGLSLAECILLKTQTASLDTFLELKETGLDSDDAYALTEDLAELVPEDGEDSISKIQKWRTCVDYSSNVQIQLSALASEMGDQYYKAQIAYEFDVTPDALITCYENRSRFDADGNGSYTNAEIQAAVDAIDGLSNEQRAVLWQLVKGATSAKNNPYSSEVGQQVLDAKATAEKSSD